MLDALNKLFENNVVSEDIRAEIEEAWNVKVTEAKATAVAELREEFAGKYEHDKGVMVEAIDKLVEDRLQAEISEFAEDRKQLAEAKAKYAVAMRENAGLLQNFVGASLKNEISELHEDQKVMAEKYSHLEDFIVEALAKEIAEFHTDKKDLAETKVALIREAKTQFAKVKSTFVKKSSALVAETVKKSLTKEISVLKEDIDAARTSDFGRKIFEAFASEYNNSYLNEKSETAKLLKVLSKKDLELAEAKVVATKQSALVESKQQEIAQVTSSMMRTNKLHELLRPLNGEQREIMTDLLESVQTSRLTAQFDKYLPAVIDGNTPAKKKATLTEGTEITGNKSTTSVSSANDESTTNVLDIRRLAGIN
jgi:hypothetical protein